MKIRSITYFLDPGWPPDEKTLDKAGAFAKAAQAAFEAAGYEVQTTRLATIPFPQLGAKGVELPRLARTLEAEASGRGFGYISLGPADPEALSDYAAIPEALAATESAFFGGIMASEEGVSLKGVRACAQVIHRAAPLDPNGFANLRFAALANVPAGSPFFPAAYHDGTLHRDGGAPKFALATESADLAVSAFENATSVEEAVAALVGAVERHGAALSKVAEELAKEHWVEFGGIDFSPAPFPEERRAIGAALERLGVPTLGMHGSLAAAATLADALDKARFPRVGFSGLMLPVLEDSTLAKRTAEGHLTVRDLLLYSAVCGTGLDTVPLPGDTSVEQLAALLLDVAALSTRLGKPLTARLMPIPGKAAGDETTFEFDYFANSRVMTLEAEGLGGALAGEGRIRLGRREN